MQTCLRFSISLCLLLLAATASAVAQGKVLTLDDYGPWNRIQEVSISPDGHWTTFRYDPNDGDATLHIRSLDAEATFTRTNGSGPEFSDDSRWVGLLLRPAEEEADRLREQKKTVPTAFHLIDLSTGDSMVVDNAATFSFAGGGGFVAIKKTKVDPDAEHDGTDLVLRNLTTGVTQVLGNVSEFAFDEDGMKLGYLVDAASASGNGLYVVDLMAQRTWPVSTDTVRYAQLAWNAAGSAVAALKGDQPDSMLQRANKLVIVSGFADGTPDVNEYDPATDNSFPDGLVLSELRDLDWNEDGSILYLGLKEQEQDPEAADDDEDEDKANVDVWHWTDERLQSVQMIQERNDRRRTWLTAFRVDADQLVRLENDNMRRVIVSDEGRWAVGENTTPYRQDLTQQGGRGDFYRVDLRNGETELIIESVRHDMGLSPNGEWFLYLTDGEIFAHNLESGDWTNLSANSGVDFLNREYDIVAERPAHGVGGWSADGESVLLYDRFDIWSVPLGGGAAVNLTGGVGAAEEIRFRLVDLDPEEDAVALDEPLLLSAYGEWTKRSGYYRVRPGRNPEPLIYDDRMIGGVEKAEDTDRVIFTQQTFEEFPDYWVSNLEFENPRKITDANPQISDYAWGRRVLVEYTNQRGRRLHATLALPAGYQEGELYPMIVYIYSLMSHRHHQFSMPVYDDRPHMSTYASNGYLVLMPDIVYDDGHPGTSALDDVTSAVQRVIDLGYADPDAIGLQGHSWGGYESSFILTQTDMFAAIVTGAPLTNLVSMNNILYKRTGYLNGPILEWSQGRMAVSPWEDFDAWVRESPIHHAENISTPFIILHGIEDGAVDWNQGLELYATARRLGKEVILLSYPGEPHHLGVEANQKDFLVRMQQFFDHHLKAVPAPDWMVQGVPFLEKGREP